MKALFSRILVVAFLVMTAATVSFGADKKLPAKPAEAAKPAAAEKAPAAKGALVDINSATEAELKAVPGVGDVYAKKIIAGRPYAKKDQLLSKNIVPKAVYEKIKDKIIAKQAKK